MSDLNGGSRPHAAVADSEQNARTSGPCCVHFAGPPGHTHGDCCICDDNPCPLVDDDQLADHIVFMLHLAAS